MKKIAHNLHKAVLTFAAWGWPIVLVDAALELLAGSPQGAWRDVLNSVSFAWILCAPVWPVTWLLDRERREVAMARLCGLREGDERERTVTGEAARSALLLSLALQSIMLVLSLTTVRVVYDPESKETKKGALSAGLGFSSARHLNPFGAPLEEQDPAPRGVSAGGYLLAPACFPVLAVLILVQLAAFRAYAGRRYEGIEA
ncbi:MAG: hypothetical protein HYV14_00325 [Elusimicrobia bacterium]|nr:hypothetical protein [Elusimicrobiota bacterium]